jgi:DNA-binding response OmpR family regulator
VVEVATEPIVRSLVTRGGIDVIVLDGEAVPAGGMGICRSLKEEIYQCPPVLLLTGRREDEWLARWSNAEATVQHPLDSIAVAHAVADLLRARVAGSAANSSTAR